MRTLLRVMTVMAVACGLVAALPVVISQIILGALWIAAIGWLVTGIFFASDDQRAFCIGASVVVSTMWTGVGARWIDSLDQLLGPPLGSSLKAGLWLDFLLLLATALANGWLCVRARRYFQCPRPTEPDRPL